jgi:hypothetical protein
MTAIEKRVSYRSQEEETHYTMKCHLGNSRVIQESWERGESKDQGLYCGFHRKEQVRQRSRFRLAILINCGLWHIGAVLICLELGLG